MKFGLFDVSHIGEIEAILKKSNIKYEIEVDADAIAESKMLEKGIGKTLDGVDHRSPCVFVEISDEDLDKLGSKLKEYGIYWEKG